MDEQDDDIVCATYTHARRHPMVLGNIGGWTPPFQLSLTQVAVVLVVFALEIETWHIWASWLPRVPGLLVAVAFPCLFAWVVRRTRLEGRSLPRLALGWLTYIALPGRGQVGGRSYRPARPGAPFRTPFYVAEGEPVR